ncbi:MAG: hypothetical protein KJO55_05650, partial [Gammaproteobacteria bacterium]|nr:hypothetical protein [Gammaproteobacteria bacterium]
MQWPGEVSAAVQRGEDSLLTGDSNVACQHFEKALALAPGSRSILLRLAHAQTLARRFVPALKSYDAALQIAEDADSWVASGKILMRMKEHAYAVEMFEHAVNCDADHAEARHHLGKALFKLGAIDSAMLHLQRAADLSDAPASWLALATIAPGAPAVSPAEILDIRRRFA